MDYRDKLNVRVSPLGRMEVMAQTGGAGADLTDKFFRCKLFTESEGRALAELARAKDGAKRVGRFDITARASTAVNGRVVMKLSPVPKTAPADTRDAGDIIRRLSSKRVAELVEELDEVSFLNGKLTKIKVGTRDESLIPCEVEDYGFFIGLKDDGRTLAIVFAEGFKTATLEKVNAFNTRTDEHFFRAQYNGAGKVALSGALDLSGGVTPDTVRNFIRHFAKTLPTFLKVVVL